MSVSRSEQMESMLMEFEHIWKMHKDLTFVQVFDKVVGTARDDMVAETDDAIDLRMRQYLHKLMTRSKDET